MPNHNLALHQDQSEDAARLNYLETRMAELEAIAAARRDTIDQIFIDILTLLAGRHFPTPERGYKNDGGWSLALSDLKRAFTQADAELASTRAHLDVARRELAVLDEIIAAKDDIILRERGWLEDIRAKAGDKQARLSRLDEAIWAAVRPIWRPPADWSNSAGATDDTAPYLTTEQRVEMLAGVVREVLELRRMVDEGRSHAEN